MDISVKHHRVWLEYRTCGKSTYPTREQPHHRGPPTMPGLRDRVRGRRERRDHRSWSLPIFLAKSTFMCGSLPAQGGLGADGFFFCAFGLADDVDRGWGGGWPRAACTAALSVRDSGARGSPTRFGCRYQVVDDLRVQGAEPAIYEPAGQCAVPVSRPVDPGPCSGRCDAYRSAVVAYRHSLHHAVDQPSVLRIDLLDSFDNGRAPQLQTPYCPHATRYPVTVAVVARRAPGPPTPVALERS